MKSIILNYKDSLLSKFADESHVQDICQLLWIYKSNNLRSFIFLHVKRLWIFLKNCLKVMMMISFNAYFMALLFFTSFEIGKNYALGWKKIILLI